MNLTMNTNELCVCKYTHDKIENLFANCLLFSEKQFNRLYSRQLLQHKLVIVCIPMYEYAISPYVIKSSYGHRNGYNHITMCNSKVNQTVIAERPATSCKHAYWPPTFMYCIVGTDYTVYR